MADNLTIGVTLDSSKLPADIALMKAQLSNANREVRNIAQDTAKQGSGADKGPLQDAVAVAGTIKGHLAAATAQQAALTVEAKTFRDRIKEAAEHMERFRARIPLGELGGATGGLISSIPLSGPLLGVGAAIAAATAAVKLGLDAARTAKEITNLANALGVSTGQIRAWDAAAKSAGVNSDLWSNFLERVATAAAKASEKQRELTINAAKIGLNEDGIVARAGGTSKPVAPTSRLIDPHPEITKDQIQKQVDQEYFALQEAQARAIGRLEPEGSIAAAFRTPAGTPFLDPKNVFENERLRRARSDTAEGDTYRKSLDERGAQIPFKTELEALTSLETKSKDVFQKLGVDLNDVTNKMKPFDDILRQTINTLSRLPGPERLRDSVELGGKSARDVTLQGFIGRRADGALDERRRADGTVDGRLSDDPDIARGAAAEEKINKMLGEGAEAMLQVGLKELEAAEKFKAGIDSVLNGIGGAIQGLATSLNDTTTAAGRAAAALDAVAKAGGAGAPLMQQASGGYISGPGTGTSDSIHALLSNGEFVVNERATSQHRTLLERMNRGMRFSAGGFVDPFEGMMPKASSMPAFAAGGHVSSSSRAPVILQVGNRSYHLSGQDSVVDALAHEANFRDTVSLGRKPSTMYGSR